MSKIRKSSDKMYLYRSAIKDLLAWKEKRNRKPLVLEGVRQVGKTELLKHFGEEFENCVFVNLEEDELARSIFDGSFEPERIISRLSVHSNQEIVAGKTLIVIDEVQENPRALTALKYFCEKMPEQHIVVAGSLLGIAIHQGVSFPVGKVDYLKIHPFTFDEFLIAIGKKKLAESLEKGDFELIAPFHDSLNELLRIYIVVGGMPEAIKQYVIDKSMLNVRRVQERILNDYERDFSKYATRNDVPRIKEIFDIIPTILAKENKKFMFGMIKKSARAREYESALLWLLDSGVASRVNRVTKIGAPLASYLDLGAFKLFFVDLGLLGAKAKLQPEMIYDEERFKEFKGALFEQFVFQELFAKDEELFYYSSEKSNAEIDFVIDGKEGVVLIEVKSGRVLASASFSNALKEDPKLKGVKFSEFPMRDNGQVLNMPLYGAGSLRI